MIDPETGGIMTTDDLMRRPLSPKLKWPRKKICTFALTFALQG